MVRVVDRRCALLAILLAAAAVLGSRGPDPAPDSFVTRSGPRLTLAGRPYHFLGFNAYQLTAQAAGENDDGWPGDSGAVAAGRARVEQLLGLAARLGLRAVRTWAFNHRLPGLNPAWLQQQAQQAPGDGPSNTSSASSSYLDCLTDTNGGSGCAAGLPLVWDEAEFVGLDWVVAAAEAAGLRLVLALGNLWPAYVGPERFLRAAQLLRPPGGGSAGGAPPDPAAATAGLSARSLVAADAAALQWAGSYDIADFYCHPGARRLYAEHIRRVTGRVNTFTGRRYSDTPAIMMWDVMNEPRCPGCSSAQLSCYGEWMALMADTAAAAAPRQLRAMGTEGFFADADHSQLATAVGVGQPLAAHNPGVGSVCEGEDWVAASQLPGIDVAILHTYWRQTEGVPACGWSRMTWWQYLPWYLHYTALHVRLAGQLGRPLVQEEFNIISKRFSPQQRAQLFAAALWQLVSSAEEGGPFAGAMWWGAAVVGGGWDDGYTAFLDAAGAPSGPTHGLAASLFSAAGLDALLADPASPSAQAAAALQRAFEQQPPTACGPLPPSPSPPPAAAGAGGGVAVNASVSSVVVKKEDEVVVATSVKVTAAAGPPSSPLPASNTSAGSVAAQLADTTAAVAVVAAAGAAAGAAATAAAAPGTSPAPSPSPQGSYQTYSSSGGSSGGSGGGGGGDHTGSSPRRLLQLQVRPGCHEVAGAAAPDTWQPKTGNGTAAGGGGPAGSDSTSASGVRAVRRRGRALQQVEVLDAFRRGGPRQQCAEARANAGQQPTPPPALGADPAGTLTPPLPQLSALLAAAEGRHVLEIIAAAAERINAL
ncbi:hypothetical protein HXX76_015476 [Chlamydomonas incerta]|uniref:mannan endo-1,4-beta-mannosidase n=1 Tax=Chlamydomonas incerta TaxID=51695 RepID=A0A835SAA2_CHLIN|nr:hypothetical protein HXX76_015476 [Chlamydomonas incerta]|eukprot:KAG2423219.1 hypothetical protein HXX76_015476 [Chlamydomonas incerta]